MKDAADLKELGDACVRSFYYDYSTGVVRWKPREVRVYQDNGWNKKYANQPAGCLSLGYLSASIRCCGKPRSVRVHRVAWLLHYGSWPKGTIDHINHDRIDNRIENLRDVPILINCQNKGIGITNKSGYVGVSWYSSRSRWVASYLMGGHQVYVGLFDCRHKAGAAVKAARNSAGFHENHGNKP